MNLKAKIKILELFQNNEKLSPLSRFYAWIAKNRLQKKEENKEKPNIVFINWKKKK